MRVRGWAGQSESGKINFTKTKMTKQEEKLIHIKLEHPEAVQSKRDVLETQKDLIEILKNIKRYHLIRMQELKAKEILYKKMKALKMSVNKLNTSMPKIKIPDIIRHEDDEDEKELKKMKKEISGSDMKQTDLERELASIQKRLQALE
jgi:hypothetical protein